MSFDMRALSWRYIRRSDSMWSTTCLWLSARSSKMRQECGTYTGDSTFRRHPFSSYKKKMDGGGVCSTCQSTFADESRGRVPLQWEQSLAPAPRCFSCFRAQHSNQRYLLYSLAHLVLAGIPHARGLGCDKAYYRETDLDDHFKVLVQTELRKQDYKEDVIQAVCVQMASDYKMHVANITINGFVRAMIPFYWIAAVTSPS